MKKDEIAEEVCSIQREKRCLVVLDDIWTLEAWNSIKAGFPINEEIGEDSMHHGDLNHPNGKRRFIPPRYSILAWRIFHLKLPTDDQLQRRGIPMVSVCQLCSFSHIEDMPHLFVNCSFAQHIWQWLACCFGTSLPSYGSLNDLWSSVAGKSFSPQLKNIWRATCFFALMAIWKSRNKLRFDNKQPSLMRVFRSVKAWVRFIAPHTSGFVRGILDSKVLSSMGVIPVLKRLSAPRIVLWHPPLIPWLKLNTDGFSKGNPGLAGCGGVFRDSFGRFIGGYCQGLGAQTAFFAELMAVILGVEFAFLFGWHHIWLESDSTTILQCISSSSFVPPWPLRIAWHNCLARIRHISFTCSHILREGNSVADRFANLGLASSSLCWHATPPEVCPYLRMDALGRGPILSLKSETIPGPRLGSTCVWAGPEKKKKKRRARHKVGTKRALPLPHETKMHVTRSPAPVALLSAEAGPHARGTVSQSTVERFNGYEMDGQD
ncbi:hypothetical protein ACLB2K_054051 [Fragaria x ananassa]